MRDPEIRSPSADLQSARGFAASAALLCSSAVATQRLGLSAIFCLGGLGIAASATILAFFGTGFFLLFGRSVEVHRSKPPSVVLAQSSSTAMRGVITAQAPLATTGAAGSAPNKAAGASMRLAALSKTPPHPPAPSASTDQTIPGPVLRAPGPAPRANAATAQPDAGGAIASPKPVPTVQRQQTGQPAISNPAPPDRAEAALSARSLPRTEIDALLTQGDNAFRRGDLASARLLYRRAYEAGSGRGALGIGASYDPLLLRQFDLWTQLPDPGEARMWYLRARELGAREAKGRLDRLNAKSPSR
jgi:hypothetical protein